MKGIREAREPGIWRKNLPEWPGYEKILKIYPEVSRVGDGSAWN